ncbi:MAG: hypothetical protein L7S67_01735, partial [Flavobacteriales bacterium]|nr:hypothetical protein [Flavobacteriales bacterium]
MLLGLNTQSQTVLYEANFEADAGGSGLSGASPDSWTATSSGDATLTIEADVLGDHLLRCETGETQWEVYSFTWESGLIDVEGFTALSIGIWGYAEAQNNTSWTAEISVLGGTLDGLTSVSIPADGSYAQYDFVPDFGVTETVVLVSLSYYKKGFSFWLDDVVVSGVATCDDFDDDEICDDIDPCVGVVDACGVCNGQGPVYECGCGVIPSGDCDCEGNQLDALGVCGGGCLADANGNGICDDAELLGCMDSSACNFDASATEDDGTCAELDVCGICDGLGSVYECG